MASWRSEKPESIVAVEYAPIPGGVEDAEDGVDSDQLRISKRFPGTVWARYSCLLGLAILVMVLVAVSIGEAIAQHILGESEAKDPDGPFGNWGKPGTGTEQLAWYPTDFLRDVIPVPCHSHNDYWRKVPLFSALYAGCTGVEADVWLRDGDLLVGHDTASLQVNRTFQTLYVNPLVEILTRQNPKTKYYNGTENGVFDTDPTQTLVLLVDLKTDGPETWPWVVKQLTPLRQMGWLSYWENGHFNERPITVVGTGNTPFDQILGGPNTTYRDAFFDAPLDKLENSPYNATNSYYTSVSFWDAVGQVYLGAGNPSEEQLEKIRGHLREAHRRGLKARYWQLPSWPIHVRNRLWEVLVQEGIDMLNVDDLAAATKQDWRKPGTLWGNPLRCWWFG
ncbi:PLC-like phosphodiesterase [Chaetomium strumarium]|uniref:Altered inheritance of mitochondria protein 6 n=1 Tax=Chaetomium strumarium TaxID=1170767 RepID=A0AAJ0M4V3_9PEZI|nr:PLC-like phosphodiesterase [Chaetomium strumarium]